MSKIIVSEQHVYDDSTDTIINETGHEKPYNNTATKIEIYQARTNGWFFEIANKMMAAGKNPGDYIVIMISLSYLEGVQQFIKGQETPQGKSGDWFRESARRVFSDQSEDVIARLWAETRCGLFHAGFTKGKIYLSHDNPEAIKLADDVIYINPQKFLTCITNDFNEYISELQKPTNIERRENFERLWDILWERS